MSNHIMLHFAGDRQTHVKFCVDDGFFIPDRFCQIMPIWSIIQLPPRQTNSGKREIASVSCRSEGYELRRTIISAFTKVAFAFDGDVLDGRLHSGLSLVLGEM